MHVRRTKIVATIGPASSSPGAIAALITAGMDGARLNMSHGNHDDHRTRATRVREAEVEAGRPIELDALVVADIAATADLPEAGDAGTNSGVMLDLLGIAGHLVLHDRARPDQAHLTTDDVNELWQFIQAG